MSGVERVTRFQAAYIAHLNRAIAGMPLHHHETLRSVLTHPGLVEQVGAVLAKKSAQTEADGEYHNAIIGRPTSGSAANFTVFEIGCTPSASHFEEHWGQLGYDSYQDYVAGILYNDGKGLDLYKLTTGQPVPEEMSPDFVDQFIIGHVLCDLESNTLLMSLLWMLADGRLAIFPPELLGGMIISRDDIQAQRCERLLHQIIVKADKAGGLSRIQGRIAFAVDGYNDDDRELFEIPEVKTYFRKLDKIAPHFLFFIASEENGAYVRLFVKMFINPEFFSSPDPPRSVVDEFITFILTRLNCVADYCEQNAEHEEHPLDPVMTIHHTYRSCGYLIDRGEAQAVLDAR